MGSSPLARGLRGETPHGRSSPRIIPARAGFTSVAAWSVTTVPDHPRSRGVYDRRAGRGQGDEGSSPLARGLPCGRELPHAPSGIIPARAGFTPGRGFQTGREEDHPRSRGVYAVRAARLAAAAGSSPLARGLLLPVPTLIAPGGIIPARAGFTPAGGAGSGRPEGSSPLARGLLPVLAHDVATD